MKHETPELAPPPAFDMNLSMAPAAPNAPGIPSGPLPPSSPPSQAPADADEDNMSAARLETHQVSVDEVTSDTKMVSGGYKGLGRGRGRSRMLRQQQLSPPGLKRAMSSHDMDFDDTSVGLDDYGVGPLGRAKGATIRGKKLKKKPPKEGPMVKMASRPYFIVTVSIINLTLMIWELIAGGGFLTFQENPFFGPSTATLIMFGAKWVAFIKAGEWWRFFTAMYLHSGIVHLAFNLLSQLAMGFKLERVHGTFRLMPIYIISGVFGNLVSAFFLPQAGTVGASGAIFGLYGVLVVDLLKNWKKIPSPGKSCAGLVCGIVISFVFGLLPNVDQWAHLGGFVAGIMAGIVFLPSMHLGRWNVKRRIVQVLISFPILIGLVVALFVVFYQVEQDVKNWCPNCKFVTCLPVFDACKALQNS